MNHLDHFRAIGAKAIEAEGSEGIVDIIPLQQERVVFQQMFEYPVSDFEAEVGFYISVLGFPTIALDEAEGYALFQHPERGYCISFRRAAGTEAPVVTGIKLLFMTTDIPGADEHLERTGLVPDREIRPGSPVQEVIHFQTPAGVAVEIWQMPTEG